MKYKVVEKNGKIYFYRLTLNQRVQHVVMFVSFTLLALTGLPLKYYHTGWGTVLYPLVGGITWAPVIHRINAVIMTAIFVFHVFYVIATAYKYYLLPLKQEGRLTLASGIKALLSLPMVPNLTDLKELIASAKYFFFITNERPSLVAHGLKEKFGYLAVFWGVPVIGLSGYFLWGEELFTKYLPGFVLNFAYIAHSDEALLASIVIFAWHLYNTHFAIAPFPMGMAWIDGYLSEREMLEDHYKDYCNAMKHVGLGNRIRDNRPNAGFTTSRLGIICEKAYLVFMASVYIAFTFIICRAILSYVFTSHEPPAAHAEAPNTITESPRFLEETLLENKKHKTFYRGFRITEEQHIKNHYHRIELRLTPDTRSHCIRCHGDFPHGSSEKVRSFLNQHALYFSCQTCHVRPPKEKTLDYFWYNSKGKVVLRPNINETPPDLLGLKLVPCESCAGDEEPKNVVAKEVTFAKDFIKRLETEKISFEEKEQAIKHIHEKITDEPVNCHECHNKERPFLSFEKIGYSRKKALDLLSPEITKMIKEYQEFFVPGFLGFDSNR